MSYALSSRSGAEFANQKVVALASPTKVGGSGPLDLTNPLGQLAVERGLTSEWTDALSDAEMRVFQRIVRMTTGFGRLSYHFTVRMLNEGNDHFSGLGKSEKNVRLALKGLEASGHIVIAPNKITGLDITVNLKGLYKVLAQPKRMKDQGENCSDTPVEFDRTPRSKTTAPPGRIRPTLLEQDLEPIENQTIVDAVAPTAVQPVSKTEESGKQEVPASPLYRVRLPLKKTEQNVPVRENPLRLAAEPIRGALKEPKLSAAALETTWRRGFAQSPQGSGTALKAWTMLDKAKINAALGKTWQGPPAKLHEFVEWSSCNWSRIMTDVFRWMTKRLPPTVPELGFLIAHRERFLDAFNRNVLAKEREKLTTHEQREMHELVTEKGYTQEEAMRLVARDQAVGLIRDENDRAKADAAALYRQAQLKERELIRQFGNRPLPHRNAPPPLPPVPAQSYEPYTGPPLFDMPEWDENTRAPVNLKPVSPGARSLALQ